MNKGLYRGIGPEMRVPVSVARPKRDQAVGVAARGVPGTLFISEGTLGSSIAYLTHWGIFRVDYSLVVDNFYIDVSTSAAADIRVGCVPLDADLYPTGPAIFDATINTPGTGLKTFSTNGGLSLGPGWYATLINNNSASFRFRFRSAATPFLTTALGANSLVVNLRALTETYPTGGWPNPVLPWDTVQGSTRGYDHFVYMDWTPADHQVVTGPE